MKILLINPPHPSIGSRIPWEHLPPLGLLPLGGPLIDAAHQVKLLDAEFGPMTVDRIVLEARRYGPNAVLLGHSGSTSGHPSATRIARAMRDALPSVWIAYDGVFPTYHWRQIMEQEREIDFIVRGEGEEKFGLHGLHGLYGKKNSKKWGWEDDFFRKASKTVIFP